MRTVEIIFSGMILGAAGGIMLYPIVGWLSIPAVILLAAVLLLDRGH